MDESGLLKSATEVTAEVLKDRSKDIYEDGLKLATKESGEALKAVVGLFNNVVLYPVKKANLTFKYKLDCFEQDLKDKIKSVPQEKLTEPSLNIAGPTLEALKYTYDTKELREMYINLLASAMNLDKLKNTHPSFVTVIKEMSPLDAIIFQKLSKKRQVPCGRVSLQFGGKIYSHAMPKFFVPDLLGTYDPFLISSSIQNLCRLAIITHMSNTIVGYDYNSFKKHSFIEQQFTAYKKLNPSVDLNIGVEGEVILLNDFGKSFAKNCLN